jgi:ParB family chromosome partitioning protein
MLRRVGNRLEIIHGRNRLDALTYINTQNIPCIVCDNISDELARYMRTSENINRDNLNPFDETLSILEYIQISCGFTNLEAVKSFINKIKNFSTGKISTLLNEEIILNGNVSAVLKKIGKYDITTFANRLSILNLNEKLVQAIKDERIDYTRAKIINSKLKDEEKIVKIIDYVEKNKLSSKKLSEYIDEEFLMANKNKKDVEVFSFINDIKDVRKKINGIKDKEKQAFINEKMAEIEKLYSLIKEQIN